MKTLADYIRSIPDHPKPGIIFRDITPLIESKEGFAESIDQLEKKCRDLGPIDIVAAPEARGFIFGAPLAMRLGAGFVPLRKPGKLPCKTVSVSYSLEYGTDELQMHVDSVKPGDRVLLLDDLLATGGTIEAAGRLIEQNGGTVAGCAFVIELVDLNGRTRLNNRNVISLITFEGE
ncbi:MAG: adenine phosphoribosyltransferase [Planctomycetia bacterium]|nr:adenine phosphoribosyltransferase [Planctomycetia bacterium]